jgi:hypothetical protein
MIRINYIRVFVFFAFAVFLLGASSHNDSALNQSPIGNTVDSFFSALAAGDIERIKSLIADPLSSQMRSLLEENKDYGNVLKEQFQGAKARIVKIANRSDYKKELTVLVQYPSSAQSEVSMLITKVGENAWKIASITNV